MHFTVCLFLHCLLLSVGKAYIIEDIVLFLYRAAYYNSQNGEDSQANENEAECIVAKNRHGETSVVRLGWDGAHTRFSNLDVSHEF